MFVENLDYLGRGIGRENGKVFFIENALPDEEVNFKIIKDKKKFAEGITTELIKKSPLRIKPLCPYFENCGGCVLQHLDNTEQLKFKEQIFLNMFARANINFKEVLPAINSKAWNYRRRAKLFFDGNNLGFLAPNSHKIINLNSCLVLDETLSNALSFLADFLKAINYKDNEVILVNGDKYPALNLNLKNNPKKCGKLFKTVAGKDFLFFNNNLEVFDEDDKLFYKINDLKINFSPLDFIQVNREVNLKMIARVLDLLNPQPKEIIFDFFSGLGNFSLPLAQKGAELYAFEGDKNMVSRANKIAKNNGLIIKNHRADLFKSFNFKDYPNSQKWLLDPPRAGAKELLTQINKKNTPQQILYVSCNPATLLRDGQILIEKGFVAEKAGVIDLFPQTSHLESICLFSKT